MTVLFFFCLLYHHSFQQACNDYSDCSSCIENDECHWCDSPVSPSPISTLESTTRYTIETSMGFSSETFVSSVSSAPQQTSPLPAPPSPTPPPPIILPPPPVPPPPQPIEPTPFPPLQLCPVSSDNCHQCTNAGCTYCDSGICVDPSSSSFPHPDCGNPLTSPVLCNACGEHAGHCQSCLNAGCFYDRLYDRCWSVPVNDFCLPESVGCCSGQSPTSSPTPLSSQPPPPAPPTFEIFTSSPTQSNPGPSSELCESFGDPPCHGCVILGCQSCIQSGACVAATDSPANCGERVLTADRCNSCGDFDNDCLSCKQKNCYYDLVSNRCWSALTNSDLNSCTPDEPDSCCNSKKRQITELSSCRPVSIPCENSIENACRNSSSVFSTGATISSSASSVFPSGSNLTILISASAGGAVLLILCMLCLILYIRRRKRRDENKVVSSSLPRSSQDTPLSNSRSRSHSRSHSRSSSSRSLSRKQSKSRMAQNRQANLYSQFSPPDSTNCASQYAQLELSSSPVHSYAPFDGVEYKAGERRAPLGLYRKVD